MGEVVYRNGKMFYIVAIYKIKPVAVVLFALHSNQMS